MGDTKSGLEIKKIFKSPFGDSLVKNSRQLQTSSRQIVKSFAEI